MRENTVCPLQVCMKQKKKRNGSSTRKCMAEGVIKKEYIETAPF